MWESADPSHGSLNAKTKTGVLECSKATEIQEPSEVLFFQIMLFDLGVEPHLVEHLDDAVRVVARAFRRLDGIREGVPAVHRAEDGSTQPHDAAHIVRRHDAGAAGLDEAVEAVFETHTLDPAVARRLHDRANDRIETGRVAAAGQDTDSFDGHCPRL